MGCAFVQMSLVVCTVCIWRCQHAMFVWKVFLCTICQCSCLDCLRPVQVSQVGSSQTAGPPLPAQRPMVSPYFSSGGITLGSSGAGQAPLSQVMRNGVTRPADLPSQVGFSPFGFQSKSLKTNRLEYVTFCKICFDFGVLR